MVIFTATVLFTQYTYSPYSHQAGISFFPPGCRFFSFPQPVGWHQSPAACRLELAYVSFRLNSCRADLPGIYDAIWLNGEAVHHYPHQAWKNHMHIILSTCLVSSRQVLQTQHLLYRPIYYIPIIISPVLLSNLN